MNVTFPYVKTNVSLQQAKRENRFYNIIDGARVSAGKTLSVINPATGQHLVHCFIYFRSRFDAIGGILVRPFDRRSGAVV